MLEKKLNLYAITSQFLKKNMFILRSFDVEISTLFRMNVNRETH